MILEIGVCVEVTLIDTITHASEVLKIPDTVLKDTHVVESLGSKLVPLVELVKTIGEQLADDLTIGVK